MKLNINFSFKFIFIYCKGQVARTQNYFLICNICNFFILNLAILGPFWFLYSYITTYKAYIILYFEMWILIFKFVDI